MEPEGISPREISRVVPRINDSSLEPKGSGDFFIPAPIPSPGGKVARPSASEEKAGRKRNAGDNPKVSTT